MKKIILVILLSMGYLITAQQEDNPFYEEENKAEKVELNKGPEDRDIAAKPGNPDGVDDLPIDDYIPLLIITALGAIVYQAYPKKSTSVERN